MAVWAWLARFLTSVGKALHTALRVITGPRMQLFALLGAGPAISYYVWHVTKDIRNGWPVDRAEQQLQILSWALYGAIGLLAIIIIALTAGLITGVKLSAGAVSLDVDLQDDEPQRTVVETTVETTVKGAE